MNLINVINEEIFNKILDETYSSINEIKELAGDVIKKIAEINFDVLNRNKRIDYIYGTYLNTIDSSKYKELKDFIEKTVIYIYINQKENPNLLGNYSMYRDKNYNPKIEREINVYVGDIKELYHKINNNFVEKSNYSEKELYLDLFYSMYSTLIHELQHAYDDYRSKNRIYHTKKFDKFLSHGDITKEKIERGLEQKDNEIAKDIQQGLRYLNLQHEVWARFSQALYNTHFTTIDFGSNELVFNMKPLKEVVKDFTRNYQYFRQLSDKMKRKLINKIAQFWHIEKEKLEKEKI